MVLEEIKRICSLGTGRIGPGIALTFALAGYQVHMYGRSDNSINQAFDIINYKSRYSRDNGTDKRCNNIRRGGRRC